MGAPWQPFWGLCSRVGPTHLGTMREKSEDERHRKEAEGGHQWVVGQERQVRERSPGPWEKQSTQELTRGARVAVQKVTSWGRVTS